MTDQLADLLAAHARARLAQYFPDLPGDRLTLGPVEGPRRHRHSFIYRLPVLCEGQPATRVMLAKVIRQAGEERPGQLPAGAEIIGKAREEYAGLARLHSFFAERADPFCGSVRPLAYLPEANAILTEEVPARTLRDVLLPGLGTRRRIDPARARETLRRCGRWLRLFHELPVESRWRRFDDRAFLDEAGAFLRELTTLGVAPAYCDRLHDDLSRFIADHHLRGREIRYAWRHGDYNLRNILVTSIGQIVGFDTKLRRACPVWEDVAIFLIELRAQKRFVLSRGRAFGARRLAEWEQAFLAGYSEADPAQPEPAFVVLYSALYALRKWALDLRMINGRLRAGQWLSRLTVDGYFRAMISRALGRSPSVERDTQPVAGYGH